MNTLCSGIECLEGIKSLMVPVEQKFLCRLAKEWNMNLYRFSLADSIKASYPLLEQIGIERQVKQNQMMRKLEVTAFAADFRANQNLSTVFFIGKPGSSPVSCDDA